MAIEPDSTEGRSHEARPASEEAGGWCEGPLEPGAAVALHAEADGQLSLEIYRFDEFRDAMVETSSANSHDVAFMRTGWGASRSWAT